MTSALRQELEQITNGGKHAISRHEAAIAEISATHANRVRLFSPLVGMPHNCFLFALGVVNSDVIQEILVRDAMLLDRGKPRKDVKFGSEFMEELVTSGLLQPDENGEIIVYFDEAKPVHAGLMIGDRVRSKWGIGNTWEHELWEVPESYGNSARRFSLVCDLGEVEKLFRDYASRLPVR